MPTPNRIKLLLIIFALLAAVIVGFSYINARRSTAEGHVTINDLADCTPGINDTVVSQIGTTMYMFVERANDYNQRHNLIGYAADIRKGTCRTETTNESRKIFHTTAILDIAEAKQSWDVAFSWTSNPGTPRIDLGTIVPTCLIESQLRYGDFKCQSVVSLITYGTDKYDPILQYMPYSGESFDLAYDPETKTIAATVLVPSREANNAAYITNVQAVIPQWLQHKGLDPNNYTIKYRVAAKQD